MKAHHILAGACALFLTTLTASAQVFVGTDTYSDGLLKVQFVDGVADPLYTTQAAGQYRTQTTNANGAGNAWTETNGRLEWTTSSTTGFNRSFLAWVSPVSSANSTGNAGLSGATPYVSSWQATIEVTNTLTGLTGGAFAYTGFEVYTTNATNTDKNAYYTIGLRNTSAGSEIVLEYGLWNGSTDFNRTSSFVATGDTTNVLLRMNYDGASKVLSTSYSNDLGATFLTGSSFDLDGAQVGISAPGVNSLGLELYASAGDIGSAVTSGQVYFDNLSVSAIPEPSTYAAFAGVGALGLACWQRRRRTAA